MSWLEAIYLTTLIFVTVINCALLIFNLWSGIKNRKPILSLEFHDVCYHKLEEKIRVRLKMTIHNSGKKATNITSVTVTCLGENNTPIGRKIVLTPPVRVDAHSSSNLECTIDLEGQLLKFKSLGLYCRGEFEVILTRFIINHTYGAISFNGFLHECNDPDYIYLRNLGAPPPIYFERVRI